MVASHEHALEEHALEEHALEECGDGRDWRGGECRGRVRSCQGGEREREGCGLHECCVDYCSGSTDDGGNKN